MGYNNRFGHCKSCVSPQAGSAELIQGVSVWDLDTKKLLLLLCASMSLPNAVDGLAVDVIPLKLIGIYNFD